jgi:DNA-binding NtrC family response regulator
LEHVVERAVLLSESEVLSIDLPFASEPRATSGHAPAGQPSKLVSLEEMERDYIEQVLRHTGGMIAGKGGAAEILDLPASTLRSRMKKLGVK